MSLLKLQTLAFLFLAFPLCDTTIFGFGKRAKEPTPLLQADELQDLTNVIRPVPEYQSRIYSKALDLLGSMQTAPSCHRLATSALLDSCQSISGSEHDAESSLDDTRSIYAAQLAICEIQSAQSTVPPNCETLTPTGKASHLHRSGAQIEPNVHLSHCLQALGTRPQWWTSYSNNRQNAVVICQAARVDIERDELIKLHKTSVQTNQNADAALAQAVEYSKETLRRQHEEFTFVKQALRDHVLEHIDAASGRVQLFLEKIMIGLDGGIQTFLKRIITATRNFESNVATLRENIHTANAKTQDLEQNVAKVFQKAAEGTAEIASIQTRRLDESNDLAIDLRQSLQQMREYDVNNLVMVVREMYGQMHSANELAISMSVRQDNFDNQMNRLGQLIIGVQANAQALQDAQVRQETTQTRLYDAMEVGLNTSLAQISVILGSATSLQAVLQDISQSVVQVTSLAWFLSRFWTWASLAVVIVLVMFAGFRLDAKSARIIVAATGLALFVKCSSAFLWNVAYGHSPLQTQLPLEWLLLFGFVIGMLISIGLCYHQLSKASVKSFINGSASERKIRRMWSV